MSEGRSPRPSIVDDPTAERFVTRRVLGWERRGENIVLMVEGERHASSANDDRADVDVAELTVGMLDSGAVRLTLGPLDGRDFGMLAEDLPDPIALDDPTVQDDGALAIRPTEPWEGSAEIRVRSAPFDLQIVGGERGDVVLRLATGDSGHQPTPDEGEHQPTPGARDHRGLARAGPLAWASRTEPDGRIQRAATIAWAREPDERLYGLGALVGPLDRAGQRLTLWSADPEATGGQQDDAAGGPIAGDGAPASSPMTAAPIPFLVSSRGYGLFVHTPARLTVDLGSAATDVCSVTVEEATLDLFVLPAAWLRGAVSTYTDLTGHAPVPPLWAFGLWLSAEGHQSAEEVETIAGRLRAEAIPSDGLLLDRRWSLQVAGDDSPSPGHERLAKVASTIQRLGAHGFKVAFALAPLLSVTSSAFRQADTSGLLVKSADGRPSLVDATSGHGTLAERSSASRSGGRAHTDPGTGGSTPELAASDERPGRPLAIGQAVGLLDVTSPEARAWWQERIRPLLGAGVSAFALEGRASPPAEARFADGGDGVERHNLYPLLCQQAIGAAIAAATGEKNDGEAGGDSGGPGLIWDRAAWAGSQRYAVHLGAVLDGSPAAMAAMLRAGLSFGLSAPGLWGHDLGSHADGALSPALYARWAAFALLSPLARLPGERGRAPWDVGGETQRIVREFARLRYRLLPYLLHCARETSQSGLPMLRPLLLEFGWDRAAASIDDQYLLGRDLLVAPVFSDSAEPVTRRVYLPAGVTWYDWWTGRPEPGGQWITQTVSLDRIPIFARAGTAIPLADPRRFVGDALIDVTRLILFSPRDGAIGASIELADDDIMGVEQARGPKRMKVYAEGLPPTLRDLVIVGVPADASLIGTADDRIQVIPDVDDLPGLGGDWHGLAVGLVPGAHTTGLELGWSSDA